jgi:hypothetical protein
MRFAKMSAFPSPQKPEPPSVSPASQTVPNVWGLVGYFLVIYLIFLVVVVVGYPLAQQFALPITSLLVPPNPYNSVLKNVLVTTGMYWGMVAVYWWMCLRKPTT